MRAKLVEYKGELAVIIPDSIARAINLKPGDPVDIEYIPENDSIVIRKIENKK